MRRTDATLHYQNKGSDSFARNTKVEDCDRTTNRGGGRDPLEPFNSQWTSTADTSTQHANPSFVDLVQWPTMQLFGLIRESTDQLEQRLQEAERSVKIARKEEFVAQTCRMQEAHNKIQVQHKLDRVQERLVEA
jgi:hypothetical protein